MGIGPGQGPEVPGPVQEQSITEETPKGGATQESPYKEAVDSFLEGVRETTKGAKAQHIEQAAVNRIKEGDEEDSTKILRQGVMDAANSVGINAANKAGQLGNVVKKALGQSR